MSSIPGLEHLEKEGWEIVRFDNLSQGEWFVDSEGRIVQWVYPGGSNEKKIIVRKIEKPKTYRPFANAAEYLPHWGKPVAIDLGTGFDSVVSVSRTGVYIAVGTSVVLYTYREAFERLKFDDGTPFGAEVTS